MPYPSTHATAEWIEETPLLIGTNAGLASLPNLTQTSFTNATVNGQSANLKASEAIDLTDSNGNVIGAPSAPNGTQTASASAPTPRAVSSPAGDGRKR